MRIRIALPLVVLAGGFASAVAADRAEYALRLTAVKSEVLLGEEIPLTVTLSRRKGKPVEVNALRLARNSVSFRVTIGDQTSTVTRIYGHPQRTADGRTRMRDEKPPRTELKKGKPLSLKLPLLAIAPGKLSITAVYTGLSRGPAMLRSDPVEVTVKAPEGKREVAAILETSEGTMVLGFATKRTFNTTLNFLTLAKEGRYDGLIFHRIIRGFMAQGGDPKGNGTGGPGYSIPREIDPDLRHVKGVLSMARSAAPDSAGSQFFLMFAARPELDGKYAAFGRVLEGLEVLDKLEKVETDPSSPGRSRPLKPPVIRRIRLTLR